MASIRKRVWRTPSGKRREAWQVTYLDGLNRRRSKQFATLAEARAWLETTDLHSESAAPNGKTVADAARAWIEQAEADELERSTLEDYAWSQKFIVQYIGAIPLAELTQRHVIALRKELTAAKSATTARRTVHKLKMVLNNAVDAGWVSRNVARRMRSAKSSRHRKASRRKITPPTRADLRTMVSFLEARVATLRGKREQAAKEKDPKKRKRFQNQCFLAERSEAMFEAIFETGARPSELRGLPTSGVKFERGGIEILQRMDRWNVLGDCKTDASYRFIPVSQHLIKVLREWMKRCPPSAQNLVFPTANGTPIGARNLNREFAKLQIDAGVTTTAIGRDGKPRQRPKYTLKDCRHGAASWWIHRRVNLKELTTRMGHSSIQVTFDIYGHIIKEVEASGTPPSTLDDDLYR